MNKFLFEYHFSEKGDIHESQNACIRNHIKSMQVGINPISLDIDSKNHVAYVANKLSNNISIINLNQFQQRTLKVSR